MTCYDTSEARIQFLAADLQDKMQLIAICSELMRPPKWLRETKRFIPLVLTKDDIGSSWMTTAYLNARFKQLLGTEKIDIGLVTPLLGISVATFERAVYALTESALSDILEDRIKEDPQLGRPFEAASTYIHRGPPRRMLKHVEILHVLAQELEKDFQLKG